MRLEIDNLSFSYKESHPIIKGLGLTYHSPDTLCILGANGAGKSTLLQCAIGALKTTSGTVRIDGTEVKSYPARDLARLVAYLPQTHVPTFEYPVIDVVTMGRTSAMGRFSTPSDADKDHALEKLDFLNIAHLKDKPYTQISGGERQLVMIASALAQEPDVLILDEPTAHLDFGNQYRFIKLVKQLTHRNMGVIMTTHYPDHALELGGETAIMNDGQITHRGPVCQVITPENLSALYNMEVSIERIGSRFICVPRSTES